MTADTDSNLSLKAGSITCIQKFSILATIQESCNQRELCNKNTFLAAEMHLNITAIGFTQRRQRVIAQALPPSRASDSVDLLERFWLNQSCSAILILFVAVNLVKPSLSLCFRIFIILLLLLNFTVFCVLFSRCPGCFLSFSAAVAVFIAGNIFVDNECLARCVHRLCGGAKRGRPVGSKNCTESRPARSSKRHKTSRKSYIAVGANTSRKNSQNRQSRSVKRVKHSRKTTRGHSSVRKSRKGKSKDRKRRRENKHYKQQRAQLAQQMRDAIAGVVFETMSQQQLKQMTLVAFYSLVSTGYFNRGAAAELSALIHSLHRETVLLWARSLEAALVLDGPACAIEDAMLAEALHSCDGFWDSLRGKHAKQLWLLADADKQEAVVARAGAWFRASDSVVNRTDLPAALAEADFRGNVCSLIYTKAAASACSRGGEERK